LAFIRKLVEYYDFGDKDYYSIGGEYFYCEKYDFGLRLIFDERTKGSKIHCNAKWINCVRTEMLEVAVHEYQHHFQDRSRPDASVYYQNTLHDDRSTQTVYLSNADEIDAYGVSIAYGIFDRYAEGALNMDFKQAAMSVPDFDDYIKTFRGQWQHPVIKQLVKKIAKNLTEIIEYYD